MVLAFLASHAGLMTLFAVAAVGLIGMAIQTNLGTFNLNAWQQTMQLSGAQFNTDTTAAAHILAPNVVIGYGTNVLNTTAASGVTVTTRSAALLFQDFFNFVGQTMAQGMNWEFEIQNTSGGTVTLAGGTGVTVVGTATVTTGNNRTWLVTYNGGGPNNPTFTVQNIAGRTN